MRSGELESFHPTKSSRESLVNGVEAAVVKWTAVPAGLLNVHGRTQSCPSTWITNPGVWLITEILLVVVPL